MALTLADFQSFGISPVVKLLWNIAVRNGASLAANSFKMRAGMRSGPLALFGLSFFSSLATPCCVTMMSGISGYSFPSGDGMEPLSSFVNTDWYCRFRMSALSLGSACNY